MLSRKGTFGGISAEILKEKIFCRIADNLKEIYSRWFVNKFLINCPVWSWYNYVLFQDIVYSQQYNLVVSTIFQNLREG